MKATKSKSNKKTAKKTSKRVAKKELQESIMDKFMEMISNLGHDASKLGKDINKSSRQLAKKLADKFHDVKETVENKIEGAKKEKTKIKKPLTTPRITTSKVAKAEKVVARVSRINAEIKPKRAYTRRTVAPGSEQDATTTSRVKSPRTSSGSTAAKPTNARKSATTPRIPKVKVQAKPESPAAVPKVTEVTGQTQDDKNNTI